MRWPNTAFGVSMGFAGQSILWKAMANTKFTKFVGHTGNVVFWVCGIAAFSICFLQYVAKTILHPKVVKFEWRHKFRTYFFFAPHLVVLMLTLGVPKDFQAEDAKSHVSHLKVIWTVSFVAQAVLTERNYGRWMYSKDAHLGNAGPPFLLSTIGWFLLCSLGMQAALHKDWGLNLPAYCFGCGAFFYTLAVITILQNTHTGATEKGNPALFLMIAPPSVASLNLAAFRGGYDGVPQAVFGVVVMLFCVLIRLGPTFRNKPPVMGTYWAYVFPISAMATAGVKNAAYEDTVATQVLAWVLIGVAMSALLLVFGRMSLHQFQVMMGQEGYTWDDPILQGYFKAVDSSKIATTPEHTPVIAVK